jgi:MFS family permease
MVNRNERRLVFIFSFASFLHDVGSDMVFSLWPLFVTNVLGANMSVLGIIDGIGDAIVSISQAISGYVSDRIGKRKIFVWLGYFFGGIARIGYSFSPSWQFLLPLRVLDRSGKIRDAPRDAMIAEVSSKGRRGENFGILRAMDNLGAVIGILLAMVLIDSLGFRNLFLLASIPSFLAVILVFFLIREQRIEQAPLFKGFYLQNLSHNLRLFTFLNAVFALGTFSYSFLLVASSRSGFSASQTVLFYLLFTLVATLSTFHFGKLSDRWGRKKVMLLSFIFWAVTLCFFIFSSNQAVIILAFVFYGLHKAALDPVQRAFVAELAPKEYIASTLGSFQMIIGIVAFPASLVAGFLWDTLGSTAPFIFSLLLTSVAACMLLFVKTGQSR